MKGFSRRRRVLTLSLLVACLPVGGCSFFSAKPDSSRFFTLTAIPDAEEHARAISAAPLGGSLGIGPVVFPGYLDRQEIVFRSGRNELRISANDRWAEPLEQNFSRVLAHNLLALLDPERVESFPWQLKRKPNYQVRLEVLRFEGNARQDVMLRARWTVIDTGTGAAVDWRESNISRRVKGQTTDALVAALSEALADLSRDIAAAVRVLKSA